MIHYYVSGTELSMTGERKDSSTLLETLLSRLPKSDCKIGSTSSFSLATHLPSMSCIAREVTHVGLATRLDESVQGLISSYKFSFSSLYTISAQCEACYSRTITH